MLEKTSWSIRAECVRSSDKRSASPDGSSDPALIDAGKISVSVANFPAPTSVSSKRCSAKGTPSGGAVFAYVLDWHRREEKSAWWEYFRLCDLSAEDLLDERSGI